MALGLPREAYHMVHKPVYFNDREIVTLSPEIFEMLGKPKQTLVRNWEIKGVLQEFEDDVIIGDPREVLKHFRGMSK